MTPPQEALVALPEHVLSLAFRFKDFISTGHKYAACANPEFKRLVKALTDLYPSPPRVSQTKGRQTSNSAGRSEPTFPPEWATDKQTVNAAAAELVQHAQPFTNSRRYQEYQQDHPLPTVLTPDDSSGRRV